MLKNMNPKFYCKSKIKSNSILNKINYILKKEETFICKYIFYSMYTFFIELISVPYSNQTLKTNFSKTRQKLKLIYVYTWHENLSSD